MQEQDGLTPDGLSPADHELESAMKSLSPMATRIDPIAAAFAAGRRSGRGHIQLWRAAAVLMLLIGAGSWLAPVRQSVVVQPDDLSEPTIAIQQPPPPPAAESMQVLEQTVREKGLDGLPAANIPAVHEVHADDIF
jgi:hypothetical protein